MSSQRKIDAARANGAKSRGPVTPAGKARSSRNALKHGLASPNTPSRTAESVCLSTENPADLEQLHQSLIHEFAPATATEALLVEEMAVARFRMQRAWEHEAALMERAMDRLSLTRAKFNDPPVTDPAAQSALAFADLQGGSGLDAIQRYEARLSRQFDRALRRLRELRAEPVVEAEPAPAGPVETVVPNEPTVAQPPDSSTSSTPPPFPCTLLSCTPPANTGKEEEPTPSELV